MNSRKKLTYVLHDIAVGGVEVALISAIPALSQKYDLRVIVLGKVDPKMVAHLSPQERNVFVPLSYPLYFYPLALPKIIRQILLNDPDLLVCSLWRGVMFGILAKLLRKKIRFYAFIHNTGYPHYAARFFNKKAASIADVVLADSIATKIFVEKEFRPKAEVKVVSFLTRPTPSWPSPVPPNVQDEIRFMYLGRINKVKNLPAAIELVSWLRKQHINAILDIYGKNDDGYEDELKTFVKEISANSFVHFKGEVDGNQKWPLFSAYHFYVQLSFAEGMAMSVTEAMQNGLVCVVSPVGEIANYTQDMKSAVLVNILDKDYSQADFDKVLNVIKEPSLYLDISKTANRHFLGKKVYAHSLIEQLETP
ncbi:glycosyltransferase family 4 protein [Dyadobacter luticola]|uniref:Glycosyltransferase family 4 protein n=1 Tax=Dyadobacter luticola TaxID=1979387 RepID=A0A5R9KXB5_9BACT|nr:glycosyltransferase family 4 protein [Dyadobacter luticola]TLV00778.1 glycosyltransferase family 4 protein [Dyadobacter luticola]